MKKNNFFIITISSIILLSGSAFGGDIPSVPPSKEPNIIDNAVTRLRGWANSFSETVYNHKKKLLFLAIITRLITKNPEKAKELLSAISGKVEEYGLIGNAAKLIIVPLALSAAFIGNIGVNVIANAISQTLYKHVGPAIDTAITQGAEEIIGKWQTPKGKSLKGDIIYETVLANLIEKDKNLFPTIKSKIALLNSIKNNELHPFWYLYISDKNDLDNMLYRLEKELNNRIYIKKFREALVQSKGKEPNMELIRTKHSADLPAREKDFIEAKTDFLIDKLFDDLKKCRETPNQQKETCPYGTTLEEQIKIIKQKFKLQEGPMYHVLNHILIILSFEQDILETKKTLQKSLTTSLDEFNSFLTNKSKIICMQLMKDMYEINAVIDTSDIFGYAVAVPELDIVIQRMKETQPPTDKEKSIDNEINKFLIEYQITSLEDGSIKKIGTSWWGKGLNNAYKKNLQEKQKSVDERLTKENCKKINSNECIALKNVLCMIERVLAPYVLYKNTQETVPNK